MMYPGRLRENSDLDRKVWMNKKEPTRTPGRNSEAANETTPLTIEAVRGSILGPLEGTQTLIVHLAPVSATLYHGFASGLGTASNSGDSQFVEFLFPGSPKCPACLQLGLCRANLG
jgi:hypothetical protein